MLKIYSDVTQAFYNSEAEAKKAEAAHAAKLANEKAKKEQELALAKQKKEQALAERKAAAGKVDTARKAYLEAQKAYREALEEFCHDYGTYHYSTDNADEIPSLFDWFGNIFKL